MAAVTTTPQATTLTLRLRKKLVAIHRSRLHDKAPSYLKEQIARHSKSSVEDVRLSTDINVWLQANNSNKFKPIKMTITRNGSRVEAGLADELKRTLPQKAAARQAPGQGDKKEERPKEAAQKPKKDTAGKAERATDERTQQKQDAAAKPKAKARKPMQTEEQAQAPAQ